MITILLFCTLIQFFFPLKHYSYASPLHLQTFLIEGINSHFTHSNNNNNTKRDQSLAEELKTSAKSCEFSGLLQ